MALKPHEAGFTTKPGFIRWLTVGFFALVILVLIIGGVINIRQRLIARNAPPPPDPTRLALKQTLSAPNLKLKTLAFAPDGKFIIAGCNDGTLKIWETEMGSLLRSLAAHARDVRSVAVSPDSRLLATCSNDQTVRLWNAQDGQLKHTLNAHADLATAVSFSPDGQTLASTSDDGTLKLWCFSELK